MADDDQSRQDGLDEDGDGADGGLLSDTSTLILAAVVAVGVLGGGFAGKQFLAPMFAGASSSADAARTQEGSHGGGGEGSGHGQGSSSTGHHEIGNLVVNPAESGGSRFLMVTLSLEVEPGSTAETLSQRDAEVRDLLNRVLGSKTVSELADIDRRDEIKAEIRKSINEMLEHGKVTKVYTPQYVLQ